jgi:glycosyltransferase involved in cell wall biosynthesis
MRILLRSPFSPYSGYGNDGIGMAQALIGAGHDVYVQGTSVQAPLPEEVAQLFTKPLEPPFDLAIIHENPKGLTVPHNVREASKTVIGWTMWEYSNLRNAEGRSKFRKVFKDFDAIFGYDQPSVDGLREFAGSVPVEVLQGGFKSKEWKPVEREWHSERFGFCMNGMLSDRKNPFVAIQAFGELKDEHPEFAPAELHLKTQTDFLHPLLEQRYDKLRIHSTTWPRDVLEGFYSKQHVLLAPSRGEGLNVPALEFQATGGVVIGTNWGGQSQWLHPSYSYPLDYTLTAQDPMFPDSLNASADKDHLKQLMLHVFKNRFEAQNKGAVASQIIPSLLSWEAVMLRFFDRMKEVVK